MTPRGFNILQRLPGTWRHREACLIREIADLRIGVPQEVLEAEDAGNSHDQGSYIDCYVRLQRARARALLNASTSGAAGSYSSDILYLLSIPNDSIDEARFTRLVDEGHIALALDLLTDTWRTDAQQALQRLRSLRFMFPLLLAPVLFVTMLEVLPDQGLGLAALVTKYVLVPVFGFLGASLSLWLDRTRPPRTVHWSAVWRSMNSLRLAGGVVVGFAIAYFSGLLMPAAGAELELPTLYLLGMAFGFSQDAFFSKLQGVASVTDFQR